MPPRHNAASPEVREAEAMTITGAEVAALGKIIDVTVKAVPWTNLVQRYQSYNLLIIGQERSGKSTLFQFLSRNQLAVRDADTKPTVDHEDSGCLIFQWKTALGANLACAFRNIGDYSGQTEPVRIAKLIAHKRPHLIIVVLDITKRDPHAGIHGSYMNWLDSMCSHLAEALMKSPRSRKKLIKKLRQVVILLNKVDCLEPANRETIVSEVTDRVKMILKNNLQNIIPTQKLNYFPIQPCSLVRDPKYGTVEDTIARLERVMSDVARSIPPP
jgi:predicted GTPase